MWRIHHPQGLREYHGRKPWDWDRLLSGRTARIRRADPDCRSNCLAIGTRSAATHLQRIVQLFRREHFHRHMAVQRRVLPIVGCRHACPLVGIAVADRAAKKPQVEARRQQIARSGRPATPDAWRDCPGACRPRVRPGRGRRVATTSDSPSPERSKGFREQRASSLTRSRCGTLESDANSSPRRNFGVRSLSAFSSLAISTAGSSRISPDFCSRRSVY